MYLVCCDLETNNCLINLDNENRFSSWNKGADVSPGFDAVSGSTLLFLSYPHQRPTERVFLVFPLSQSRDEEVLAYPPILPPHPPVRTKAHSQLSTRLGFR